EIAAQAIELFRFAEVFGRDRFVEFGGERAVVGTARLVTKMTWPLRLARRLRIAHVGVVGHVGGRRLGRFGGGVGHILGRHLRVFHAHALHLVGIGGLAVLAGVLLAAVLLTLVFVLGVVTAVLAHLERVEQIMHDVAELPLILDKVFKPIEITAGAVLDQRAPQIDQPLGGWRRRHTGKAFAHHECQRVLYRSVGTVGDFVKFSTVK